MLIVFIKLYHGHHHNVSFVNVSPFGELQESIVNFSNIQLPFLNSVIYLIQLFLMRFINDGDSTYGLFRPAHAGAFVPLRPSLNTCWSKLEIQT